MRSSDNAVVWAKIGSAKFLTEIAKDIICYGGGCVAVFYSIPKKKETLLICNSYEGNGDGIRDLTGHKTSNVFAYAENCKNARIFVKNYPKFDNIFVFEDGAAEGYVTLTFSVTSLLVTLGNFPNFTLSVWNWRTQEKYSKTDTNIDNTLEHVIRCNWSKPINMVHLCKNTKKIYYWDLYSCCREPVLAKHEVIIPNIDNIAPLTHTMWTTENGLYVCDSHGSIYTVDNQFILERVVEANYTGESPPNIVWFKAGIAVCGPDASLRHYIKKSGSWTNDWTLELEIPLYSLISTSNYLLGLDKFGEIVITDDETGKQSYLEGSSSYFADFCLIYPRANFIAALKKNIFVYIFKVETGELVSRITLDTPADSINSNPFYPYLALSCKTGILILVSVYNPEKPTVMVSLVLSKSPIQRMKYFEKGRIIVTADLDKGEFFIIEDSTARVISEIKSGHLLRHFQLNFTEQAVSSWGYDGFIFVRDPTFQNQIAVIRHHHRYDMGVRKAYLDPFSQYVVSLGFDNVLCCTLILEREIDETLVRAISDLMQSDKFALMFKRPSLGLKLEGRFAGKTWVEAAAILKIENDEIVCRAKRNEILKDLEDLKLILNDLVTKNLEGPSNEYIDLKEFYLNAFAFNEMKEENRELCKHTQTYLKAIIDANNVVTKHMIKTYWDPMGVHGVLMRGIFQKTIATSYALLPTNQVALQKLAWVEEQRKIEEFLSVNSVFHPWLKMIKEEVAAQLKFRHRLANQDYNTMVAKYILEETQLSVESQVALAGSVVQLYIDRNPWHYQQRQLVSFYQCDLQEVIAEEEVVRLKKSYNAIFKNLIDQKIREMDNIREKHEKLRHFVREYNYFSENKIFFEIEDPIWTQEEQPSTILTVTDDELTISPYVSPSEQAILDAKAAEEEKIRIALLADDFREKALNAMMNGVLEVKWEDELKRDPIPPKCMIEKRPQDFTEEDQRNIHEYEERVIFLNNERERYKNLLELDFAKISISLRDSIKKLNQRLMDTIEFKLFIDSAMNHENLRINRIRLNQCNIISLVQNEEEIKARIDQNDKVIEELQENLKGLNEVLTDCKVGLEVMQSKEKVLEKAFKKDIQELSSPVQEQAVKIYRRRPKWNFRQLTVSSILMEMARCLMSQEKSLILTPDCVTFLDTMDYYDKYEGVPPSIDESYFRLICRHRRLRVEHELKLRKAQITFADGEQTVATYQKRLATKKEKNIKLNAKLKKCKEDYIYCMNNIQIQIVLRKGLVEIPLTGDILNDFNDAVLVPKREIEHINELIKKAGNNKLKTIRQNMAFRRRIMVTEWNHKKLRMTINDLIEQIHDINGTKLLRDMQVYLRAKATGRKAEADSLEQELDVITAIFETNMRDKKQKLSKLLKQLQSYQEHNRSLDQTIQDLNIDICSLKFNHDPDLDTQEKDALKSSCYRCRPEINRKGNPKMTKEKFGKGCI